MDEFIRQVPHDNTQLEDQWPSIFDKLHKLSIGTPETDQPTFKARCLNALADYVLADADVEAQIKLSFVEATVGKLPGEPLPSLDDLVNVFCRLLDASPMNKMLNLKLIQKIYYQFRLGECLCKQGCVDSIDRIVCCLQQYAFSDEEMNAKLQEQWKNFLTRSAFSPLSSDTNKLNHTETMLLMRRTFQQFYR